MGCFDSLMVPCVRCGESLEFQSKAGDCLMEAYHLSDCPPAVAGDLHDNRQKCPKCGAVTGLAVQTLITPYLFRERDSGEEK